MCLYPIFLKICLKYCPETIFVVKNNFSYRFKADVVENESRS